MEKKVEKAEKSICGAYVKLCIRLRLKLRQFVCEKMKICIYVFSDRIRLRLSFFYRVHHESNKQYI